MQADGTSYTSLATWQANFGDVGAILDAADPFVGTGTDEFKYRLKPGSLFFNAGVDLTKPPYNLNIGTTDGLGGAIVYHSMGADCSHFAGG